MMMPKWDIELRVICDLACQSVTCRQHNSWSFLSISGCRGGGVTHHSIISYQERLYGYLEQLALQRSTSAAATLPGGQRAASRDAEDPGSLFRQAPRQGMGDNPLLDEVGRFAGMFPHHPWPILGSIDSKAEQCCSRPSAIVSVADMYAADLFWDHSNGTGHIVYC